MIKVSVGQVWVCDVIGGISRRVIRDVIDNGVYHDDVFFECANHISTRDLWPCGTFVPQNDLEFAAVNLDKWYFAADHIHVNDSNLFICDSSASGAINYNEWQAMRYHLGLDTKPHYKMINGEWVK